MSHTRRTFVLWALLATAFGCAREKTTRVALEVSGAANAHVTLAADGTHLAAAWAATTAEGTDIYLARSDDAGRTFGAPIRVNDIAGDASINAEAPPRVLLAGQRVEVVWVSKRGGLAAIRAAGSTDGGVTFAPARTVTAEAVTGARGWQTAAFGADGTVHVAWLDGRNAVAAAAPAAQSGAAHVHHGDMRQDIYHAMWRGTAVPVESLVASDVCFCCKTALVSRGDNVYVAWRHLFSGGVRDIAVARSTDGGRTFSHPVRVSADNWHIDACPDDGPALAIDDSGTLHVTWPTLVQEGDASRMGVFRAESVDGGQTFSPRIRVDPGIVPASHPKIALDAAGQPAIAWDETGEGRRVVRLRIGTAPPLTMSEGRIASYPAVALSGDALVIAWTDQSEGRSMVRVARVIQARP